jgi:(E)-4-hydroxy-3-methylbut-2-enyl-diphosphate synthase
MATGVAPAPLPHVRVRDGGIGFTRTVDFAKVMSSPSTGTMRTSSSRGRALVAKSSSTRSDTMELEPSSEGSPLLGTYV